MTNAHTQSRQAAEKMTEVTLLKEQAAKAQENVAQLFKSLSSLEKHLDPEDRDTIISRWPILKELRAKSVEQPPSIERYISRSSEIGVSTSPLLDKMIVTAEPVKDEENTPVIAPTTSTSLAFDKLKKLSIRAIYK